MPVAVAVWSVAVSPGKPLDVIPQGDILITNVALGEEIADSNSRTTIKLTYLRPVSVESDEDEDDDEGNDGPGGQTETTVLCSLTPGKIEQASVNITLEADEEFLFEAVGKNTVYLTGNYVDQSPDQVPYNDDSEPEDEDDFDLRDVSSDVEIDPAELAGIDDDESDESDADRFEEVDEIVEAKTNVKSNPASLKRPRESDTTDTTKPSKEQEKKTKKQKAANGEAVPAAKDATDTGVPQAAKSATEKKDKKKKKKEDNAAKNPSGEPKPGAAAATTKGQMNVHPSGLKIQDVKVGTGPQAKAGQSVSMRYIGKLSNGKIFDSNTKGSPFTFKLGKGEVIKGWDEGIAGMQVGGERLIVVPPQLGYGNQKMPDIPRNSTLTFEVKMVNIK